MISNKITEAVETWGTNLEPVKTTRQNSTKFVAGSDVLKQYETLKAKEKN